MAEGDIASERDPALEDLRKEQLLRLTRRTFLVGAAGAIGTAYVRPTRLLKLAFPAIPAELTAATGPINPIQPIGPSTPVPDITIAAERDSDLLLLDFAFYGFAVQEGSPPSIQPTSDNNVVVIQFPPQAIGEGTYPWFQSDLPVDPPPILSDLSGPSRLCFRLGTTDAIPLPTMTVADLLEWNGWELLVPAVASVNTSPILNQNATIPTPTEPTEFETAIEFPYALFLAPTVDSSDSVLNFGGFTTGFASRPEPLVSSAGVVDLWTTSLVGSTVHQVEPVVGDETTSNAPYVPQVAAVWAADYGIGNIRGVPSKTPENKIEYDLEVIQ